MSESSSDTESSCGWTVISNEGSDIETLGPENGADYDQEEVDRAPAPDQPASPREEDAAAAAGDSSLDATLIEETVVEAESGQQAGEGAGLEEHVPLCSSSDHSDIITLGDSRETEIGAWEEPVAKEDEETTNEELYLGTSSSSQYTFSAAETTAAGWLKIGRGFCRSVGRFSGHFTEQLYSTRSFSVFPAERPVRRDSCSTSTEDEDGGMKASPVVRRRRLRRSTAGSEPEEQQEVQREREEGGDGAEDEAEEHREARIFAPQQRQVSGTLNKCILLALIIAISMGFGHFYGTVQIQERHRMVEKTRVNELSETRELHQCRREKDTVSKDVVESLREDLEDKRDMVMSLTGIMDKITKENQHLRAKDAELQAQREDLFEQLQQAKTDMESRQKHLALENQALKSSLEREEASLSVLQDELRHLRAQIRELEEKGAGADSILSENQRLKDHLLEEKQRVRSFLNQKEALMAEAQVLRKELDKERKVTDKLREELEELSQKDSGTDEDPETEELQTRLQELEKKLSFEQQRSDLWERLYVETKEERAKGDRQIKARKPKEGMMGKVKETFDAVKNSTKEFVHHHKEQIKKAKEAVKENLKKFSDSVKSTFRHLKDSALDIFERSQRPQQKRSHERKDAKIQQQQFKKEGFKEQSDKRTEDTHWQHHRPLHQHPRKSTVDSSSFQADRNIRKSGAQKEQVIMGQRAVPKGCTGVFDCAYQESMSLFNKAMDPIRADEFNQLLHSYLQQEVGHFHHWRELESFINNFFHNGLFIHDQMLFTDFVSGVEDYLEDMDEYQGGDDEVFEDLDDYIYRHFFGDTYLKRYGPSVSSWLYFECSEVERHLYPCEWEGIF
ncbi:cell cycle progression protein 1 isoform X3 [Colossoma macropomum]|uniref:cell cycle progression protein 1 isoform X3 n=1 Tax=Colossoma macropomum TaxID=42526 RepID=UPI0018641C80|nr:cell cycle progression protein 1 isoform X3 [Colossoma macropomum]